ncbi:hypothetical protein BDZ89DRAFT_1059581, partial [Hymenopellis radicata]
DSWSSSCSVLPHAQSRPCHHAWSRTDPSDVCLTVRGPPHTCRTTTSPRSAGAKLNGTGTHRKQRQTTRYCRR